MHIRFLLVLITALILGAPLFSRAGESPAAKPSSVSLTYVANEGVLISGAREKVLIDAIFTTSFGIFEVPQAAVLEKMKAATAPFDRITCYLTTHGDLDHISTADTMVHMLNDPTAVFFAPEEVAQQMQKLPRFEEVKARIHAAAQTGAATDQRISDELTVRAIPLDHLTRPPTMPKAPYNVGHLFTVDGIKFFHTGDMGSQNIEAFKRAKLSEERVDVVIVNFYFFRSPGEEAAREILAYLNPKLVLLAHLTPKGHVQEAERILKLPGLPRIVPLDTSMQVYAIGKDGAEVRVSGPVFFH